MGFNLRSIFRFNGCMGCISEEAQRRRGIISIYINIAVGPIVIMGPAFYLESTFLSQRLLCCGNILNTSGDRTVYNTFLQELIQINFIPICIILFLIIFLRVNDPYEHDLTQMFYPILIMIMLLIIDDNVDYYAFNTVKTGFLHVFTAVVGYNLRILIMLSLTQIALWTNKPTMEVEHLTGKRIMLYLPGILNLVITCLAFFTKLVFWYGEDGNIMRGPLAYTPHIVCLYYSVALFAYALFIKKNHRRDNEATIIAMTTCLALLGTFVEMAFQLRGILIGVISMAVSFYYLCLHIEYFKYDILTGALNRTSFYADLRTLNPKNSITIISVDLNDLKKINDVEGHLAGDTALKCMANVISDNITRGCHLYRVGGDEFAVICKDMSSESVETMMRSISEGMRKTPYTFAMGYSQWDGDENFRDVIARADEQMYINKRELKHIE